MSDLRDFLPPPPWEGPPWEKKPQGSRPISGDDFLKYVVGKYKVYFPEGVIHLTEPVRTTATALGVASFCIGQPRTRDLGIGLFKDAEEEIRPLIRAGLIEGIAAQFIQQQFAEITRLLGNGDFWGAGEVLDELGTSLNVLATHWMASYARRIE